MTMWKINRRRFITISAVAAGLAVGAGSNIGGICEAQAGILDLGVGADLMRWQGAALGAKAQIMLYSDDRNRADEIFKRCQREMTRLEKIISLYVKDSAINRLNAHGILHDPDFEFLELMSRCLSCYQITGGAFDVTIQPLWQLYANHFATVGADPSGPSQEQVENILRLVGSDKIILEAGRISFTKPGMGISLNGVAQGYMTDRVAKILKEAGFENILVHMGETMAMGQHGDGRPWTAGISSPLKDDKILLTMPLKNQALATSGGYGSPFSDQSRLHHLLDPKTGQSAHHHGAVSVVAQDATTADMLSTAFYVMDFDKVPEVWAKYPAAVRAIFVDPAGKITNFTG
ncbi:MAG: FAD:protein FMN transferase [Emcibacter sp.]|nr:FAD:protein FMN transferase [Emcibacter sp.]